MAEKKAKQYVSDNAQLMAEWNWEKNNKLNFNPKILTVGSNKKVWWKCNKGHEWEATINNRNHGKGCPFCSGRCTISGENDLQTVNPTLAKEWNYERNDGLTPSDVLPNSNKKIWWKCSKGHEWQASVNSRSQGHGCPYCAGQKVLEGYNDLKTLNPDLAKEWNYEKNNRLKPEYFTANSNVRVWWMCDKGHEWTAKISDRNHGNGCPYCSNRKILAGYNDLQTVNPILANEWNFLKNKGLTPTEVMPNSHKSVWWKCAKGHEWKATVGNRNKGKGCPQCANERRKKSKQK